MNVGNPSNLARIQHLCRHDLARRRLDLVGKRYNDEDTRRAIREVDR